MAKKAAKKEATAAKAQKKGASKAKATKVAKPVPAVKKETKKMVSKEKPAPPAKKKVAEKSTAPKVAAAKSPLKPPVEQKILSAKPAKVEKAEKRVPAVSLEASTEAPKKEKKVKIDKTGLSEDQVKWHEMHEKYKGVKAPMYTISGQFEAKAPIQHKIFGWGYVLSNEYDRLEVLFEDGKRMLISNRKLS